MTFASATARTSALPAPTEGMTTYLEDLNQVQVYNGSSWEGLVTTTNVGTLAPQGNAVINGAFDIWQRGTTFTNPGSGSGVFSADRWNLEFADANPTSYSITRQTFTPGTAPVAGYEGQFYARSTITTVGSTTVYRPFTNRIEDVRTFAGQTATLSFWAKADSSRTLLANYKQNFGTGGSASSTTLAATFTLTTSWVRYTTTISVPSISGKTIGTSNSLQINLQQAAASGSVLDIWGVQLEAGSVATPFKCNAPSVQAELAACQRYYWRTSAVNIGEFMGLGPSLSGTLAIPLMNIPTTMRVKPTSIDYSSVALWDGVAGGNITITLLGLSGRTTSTIGLDAVVASGLTQYRTYYIITQSTSGYVGFSAEL